MNNKRLAILGTRGIPACYGGFESFAEHLALFLTQKGWEVTVYCQKEGTGPIVENEWRGVKLISIPIPLTSAMGTIVFDWKSTIHASSLKSTILTLGYNTALFCVIYRIKKIPNIINMDGIEWKRGKWTIPQRCWLYMNEKFAALLGNHLIADHPEIKKHLSQYVSAKKISTIPYRADIIETSEQEALEQFNIEPNKYIILIARPEPENSILEIVRAYSRKKRNMPLVILGRYIPEVVNYHEKVMKAANQDVKFIGAIYDKNIVTPLRFFARFYIHGHTVGGTNPSLVEALGASNAVLAHNNRFNRWVAGEGGKYFKTEDECADLIEQLIEDDFLIGSMKKYSKKQMLQHFSDEKTFLVYEELLEKWPTNDYKF